MSRKRLFNQTEEKEICSLYKSGKTLVQIATMKNCHKLTIKSVLERNKINRRPWTISDEGRHKHSESTKERWKRGELTSGMLGKTHTEKTKQTISKGKMGDKNPSWNGGKQEKGKGINKYIYILTPNHPSVQNTKSKYVAEHRLVMEKHLGRYLNRKEFVHHKNGIRNDNCIENLEIVTFSNHSGKVICPYCEHEFSIK